ncbi:NAD(+) hydrolase SARM1-like isoform X2 [Choloepus didactylus]|nr:NAD(+) hydrolase SARM1-like isoform X2 [Choloepus didactylus]
MSGPRPGAERLAVPGPEGGGGAGPWWAAGCRGPREVSPGVGAEVQGALERALPELAEVFQLVEEAWLLPAVGREVAQGLCEAIRLDGGLDLLPRLLQASELETRVQAARLLEQILVAENRHDLILQLLMGNRSFSAGMNGWGKRKLKQRATQGSERKQRPGACIASGPRPEHNAPRGDQNPFQERRGLCTREGRRARREKRGDTLRMYVYEPFSLLHQPALLCLLLKKVLSSVLPTPFLPSLLL